MVQHARMLESLIEGLCLRVYDSNEIFNSINRRDFFPYFRQNPTQELNFILGGRKQK